MNLPLPFSDLLTLGADGHPVLPPEVHHLPHLLEMTAEEVLASFKQSQVDDFTRVIDQLSQPDNPLKAILDQLAPLGLHPIAPEALKDLFLDLHDHVMGHPVWRHPFFLRVFEGRLTADQAGLFAVNYFNQIKNTRQCVALALGRFNGLMERPHGQASERVSELTQIVLAQLLADEYGVSTHAVDGYPGMAQLFASTTHIVMYRQLFEGLGIPFALQDVPMLNGVADNVLTQRLLAGDPAFSPLEALASVGLGMEWGVPEFFTLLLGGLIRFAWKSNLRLNQHHLLVLTAHVKYDVLHAIAVVLATSFHCRNKEDVASVKNATNMLMASRFAMMSDLYRHVFKEDGPLLAETGLEARYTISDGRIVSALRRARQASDPAGLADPVGYARHPLPFVLTA
ncbi:MAG: hypothetical protein EPN26_10540 [Rhodospirillales bacterium]|nr:MAG: hypothetical protein EPN26_10540 [Rhodospirillales bacterium]